MNQRMYGQLHPLEHLFRPIVATSAIERLADAINAAIDAGYRGIGAYGYARFGKTYAITYLMDHPCWLGNRRAVQITRDVPKADKRTDRSFFQSLLILLGVRVPDRVPPDGLCGMVASRFIEAASSFDTRLIIFYLDEAQRLLPSDYEHLVTLDNRMSSAGYYLLIVFIHQRDISGFSNETFPSQEYPPHVTGRFMIRKHAFTGLSGVEEVAYALMRYDEGTEWPPGSGISYTRHYAEDAFVRGFRLAKHAQQFWDTACAMRAMAKLSPDWTWPMKSFEGAVVHLLTYTIPGLSGFERLTEEQIACALEVADFVELEQSRQAYAPKRAS